jgi:hypothetical protein
VRGRCVEIPRFPSRDSFHSRFRYLFLGMVVDGDAYACRHRTMAEDHRTIPCAASGSVAHKRVSATACSPAVGRRWSTAVENAKSDQLRSNNDWKKVHHTQHPRCKATPGSGLEVGYPITKTKDPLEPTRCRERCDAIDGEVTPTCWCFEPFVKL